MNAMVVDGSSCSSPFNAEAATIGETTALCLIFVVSLVGNSFIGIIIYKTQSLQKPINFFLANMAMSDLLYAIFLLPWEVTKLYPAPWLIGGSMGQALCKLVPFVADVSTLVSIQSLVVMAVDRFGAVRSPFRSPLISPKQCLIFIPITWIVAMAIMSPYLFAFKLVDYRGKQSCVMQWSEAFGELSSFADYLLSSFIIFYYIPIALLIILYSFILIKLKTQVFPGNQSINVQQQRERRSRHVLKMAIATVLGFVACWLPFSVITLLWFFEWHGTLPCGTSLYWRVFIFIARANCAINPCICFIFSENYRLGLKRIMRCFN